MARKRHSRKNTPRKQATPDIPAEQLNTDYGTRRLMGQMGEVTMSYLHTLESQYLDMATKLMSLMEDPDFEVDPSTLRQFIALAPHLTCLPENAERRDRLLFIYSELSCGRVGYAEYSYEIAKAKGWEYSDHYIQCRADNWEKDFGIQLPN